MGYLEKIEWGKYIHDIDWESHKKLTRPYQREEDFQLAKSYLISYQQTPDYSPEYHHNTPTHSVQYVKITQKRTITFSSAVTLSVEPPRYSV